MFKTTIGFTISTFAIAVSLSGCAGVVGNSADVNITLNTQPFFATFTEDGQPCQSIEKYSLTNPLKDSQVTLKTAEGQVVGVANAKGWDGDPAIDLDPQAFPFALVDGDLCAYELSFTDVDLSSDFYTLEFSVNIAPVTLTKAEIESGPSVFLD